MGAIAGVLASLDDLRAPDMLWLRVALFVLGQALVLWTMLSAIRTFVLPRSANDFLTRRFFLASRRIFNLLIARARTYRTRDSVMAYYAPVTLILLPGLWLTLVLLGYMVVFWSLGGRTLDEAFATSGSSLFTLGFASLGQFPTTMIGFSEAAIGLALVALLIAYLPTIYTAFSQREKLVTMLEVRAGSPPSAVEMLLRYHRIHGLQELGEVWPTWETWFVEVEETHTSLASLSFFRSPQHDRSWITAAGAVLDAAALTVSTVDIPHDPHADLCIRAGFLALRHIADFFRIAYDPDPRPTDPIRLPREEFNRACEQLAADGVPLKSDRDQAWRDFAGWRVNYEAVLLDLVRLLMAPPAPWSSDLVQADRMGLVQGGRVRGVGKAE